ncbi:alpha/beta hydrolase [Candidatus Bipolaricaulota bacterium]|nr:alpha/beta hydrolase [Candidatus Bipolaricaulota bacterium]
MPFPILRMFLSEKPRPGSLLSAGHHLFWSRSDVTERKDLQYGSHERHKLDIFEPVEIDADTEFIFFVHGGGWESGNKNMHRFIGRSWARKNFIVVLPNYRLAPEFTYPDQVRDVSRSLAWLQDNYGEYPGSLYLAGHSAGAHLAATVGFSERWREDAGLKTGQIAGLILLAGVFQFYPYDRADPRVKRFIGGKRYWEDAQPFNHLKKSLPPVFLAHGGRDEEVLPEQSIRLSEKLTELEVRNEFFVEENAGHLELLLETSRNDAEFWSQMENFFREEVSR